MQRLNIVVLSDWEASGGANIAALRLTQGFAEAGHRVTRIYQKASVDNPQYETRLIRSHWATNELSPPGRLTWKLVPEGLHQRLHERSSEAQLARILADVRPDVINVHNLHIGRWSPEMLRVCAAYAPVVCKLCDTWMFTGRCYNPGDCEKYLTQCDHECPTASEYPMLKPSRIQAAFELRREILERCANIAAVAPSRWIGRMAVAGIWKRRPVFRIRNGIDLAVYAPVGQQAAQRALGLRPEDPVLLCCATQLTNRKKGLPLLVEALAKGVDRRVQLLLLGSPVALPAVPDVDIHQMGYIENDRVKALLYNASDLYVHPSIADNSPNTVIEALACGTPVLAFPVDGVPEMVIPGQTGWLAAGVSADFLNATLRQALLDLGGDVDFRKTCRQFAESHYDMGQVIRSYEHVFDYMRTGVAVDLPERVSPAGGRPELTELVSM